MRIPAPIRSVNIQEREIKASPEKNASPIKMMIGAEISTIRTIASKAIELLFKQAKQKIAAAHYNRRENLIGMSIEETLMPKRITTNKARREVADIDRAKICALRNIRLTAELKFSVERESAVQLYSEMADVISPFNDFLGELENGEIAQKTKRDQILKTAKVANKVINALKELGKK